MFITIIEKLEKISRKVKSNNDIKHIATISCEDEDIGALIAKGFEIVGNDGVITLEESNSMYTTLDVTDGIKFDKGYVSTYFCTNNDALICEMDNPYILVTSDKIDSINQLLPILEQIAAKAEDDGEACVAYIGPNGAGHFVKMVHNGIEYGDMQLIAESYHIMRELLDLSNDEIATIFKEWNDGELDSFLIEITADALTKLDPSTGKHVVDIILDRAGNKGTGKWTSQEALDLGTPLPMITEAVFARYISALKDERVEASEIIKKPNLKTVDVNKEEVIEELRQALYFSKLMSYAQGFSQLRMASEEYNWDLQYGEIAKIWRAGCIIRARFLQDITNAYEKNPELKNLILDDFFNEIAAKYQQSVRDIVGLSVQAGIPVPAYSSAISYYDSYRSARLPANIIQAQRDYFGAHTYERVDKEGDYHFDWYGDNGEEDWS